MSKSRQTRKGSGGKRSKRPVRSAAEPVSRAQQEAEAAAPADLAGRVSSAQRTGPANRAASTGRPASVSRAPYAVSAATATAPANFSQEYHYVLGDLKRIAILAAAMFAILIALALILT